MKEWQGIGKMVIIKNSFAYPNSCIDCPFYKYTIGSSCQLTYQTEEDFNDTTNKMSSCPLVQCSVCQDCKYIELYHLDSEIKYYCSKHKMEIISPATFYCMFGENHVDKLNEQ